ncbi:MAG: hypothetical protein EXX96DRAFT_492392, partial [Benjaminiella poitrasii]
ESHISLRSLGFSIALRQGIPFDDIVILENWGNSDTFQHRYHREHMSLADFTTAILAAFHSPFQVHSFPEFVDDVSDSEDEFHDASEHLPDVSPLDQHL